MFGGSACSELVCGDVGDGVNDFNECVEPIRINVRSDRSELGLGKGESALKGNTRGREVSGHNIPTSKDN